MIKYDFDLQDRIDIYRTIMHLTKRDRAGGQCLWWSGSLLSPGAPSIYLPHVHRTRVVTTRLLYYVVTGVNAHAYIYRECGNFACMNFTHFHVGPAHDTHIDPVTLPIVLSLDGMHNGRIIEFNRKGRRTPRQPRAHVQLQHTLEG